MRELRAGVLSAGAWSEVCHLPALASLSNVSLQVVTRPDAERARRVASTFDVPHWSTDWREALGLGLDIVVVSSPPTAHEAQVVAALESGAHVLCEKPFALSATSARHMVEAAKANDRHLLVALGWAATPVFVEVRQSIQDGRLGALQYVTLHLEDRTQAVFSGASDVGWGQGIQSESSTYCDPAVSGGGAVAATMSHELAMLLWLVDAPAVRVSATSVPLGAPIDLHASALVEFGNGATATVSCASSYAGAGGPHWQLSVYGSHGQLVVDSRHGFMSLVPSDGATVHPSLTPDDFKYRPAAPIHALVDAARGVEPSGGMSAELACQVVELTEGIRRSARMSMGVVDSLLSGDWE